ERQLDNCRADDVTGIVKPELDAWHYLNTLAISHRAALFEYTDGVTANVNGSNGTLAATRPPAVFPLGILFLDMCRIHQHYLQQVAGGIGSIDRAAVAFGNQARQQTAMVDMGMGDNDSRQVLGIEGERTAVAVFVTIIVMVSALLHTAFEQDQFFVVSLYQITGTGHLPGCAQKTQ